MKRNKTNKFKTTLKLKLGSCRSVWTTTGLSKGWVTRRRGSGVTKRTRRQNICRVVEMINLSKRLKTQKKLSSRRKTL
jgi:hypothetical protein